MKTTSSRRGVACSGPSRSTAIGLAAFALLAVGCDRPNPGPPAESNRPAPRPTAEVEVPPPAPAPADAPAPGHAWGVVTPLAENVVVISTRHTGLAKGLTRKVGEKVGAGDVLAEIDSVEVAQALWQLRQQEVQFHEIRWQAVQAESRLERAKLNAEAKDAEAGIAEDAMLALRDAETPESSPELRQVRMQAIELRQQVRVLIQEVEDGRREVAVLKERTDAIVRSAEALRASIGPHVAPVGTQGRWGADVDRPSIVRLSTPVAGVVIDRFVDEGAGVQAGAPIVRVADLSTVRIVLEAGEAGLPLDALDGKEVEIRLKAGGEVFGRARASVRSELSEEGGAIRRLNLEIANPEARLIYAARVDVDLKPLDPKPADAKPVDSEPAQTPPKPAGEN